MALMAAGKTKTLALILVIATLLPAASAWQEKLRSVTLARTCIPGAVALANLHLPTTYVPQVQDTTSGGNSSSNGTTNYDSWKAWSPSCSTRQPKGCLDLVQDFCRSSFALCIFSLFLSFVILSMPDQVGDKCLLDHNDYWQGRMIANTCLYVALVLTLAANYVASNGSVLVYMFYVLGAPAAMIVGAVIWISTPGIGAI